LKNSNLLTFHLQYVSITVNYNEEISPMRWQIRRDNAFSDSGQIKRSNINALPLTPMFELVNCTSDS